MKGKSSSGQLDTGYAVSSLGMVVPTPVVGANASSLVDTEVHEVQLVELVANDR